MEVCMRPPTASFILNNVHLGELGFISVYRSHADNREGGESEQAVSLGPVSRHAETSEYPVFNQGVHRYAYLDVCFVVSPYVSSCG